MNSKNLKREIRVPVDIAFIGKTVLPDNLNVRGILDLSDAEITSLPKNLIVAGDLILSGTKITSLPDDLLVGGEIIGFSGDKSNYEGRFNFTDF